MTTSVSSVPTRQFAFDYDRTVVAFHGTNKSTAEKLVAGIPFGVSENELPLCETEAVEASRREYPSRVRSSVVREGNASSLGSEWHIPWGTYPTFGSRTKQHPGSVASEKGWPLWQRQVARRFQQLAAVKLLLARGHRQLSGPRSDVVQTPTRRLHSRRPGFLMPTADSPQRGARKR
jgi:hypothetical protein